MLETEYLQMKLLLLGPQEYFPCFLLMAICQQIWKTQQWPQDWKRSVVIPIPKKGNAKECSNYGTIVLISHASKVMLKILQVRLQQYVNRELSDVQAGFRKGRGTRDQIDNIRWIMEKAREFQKTSISALLTMPKPLTVCIMTKCGKFWKRWEYQTTWPASWEVCIQVQKQRENWTWNNMVPNQKESMSTLYIVTLLI